MAIGRFEATRVLQEALRTSRPIRLTLRADGAVSLQYLHEMRNKRRITFDGKENGFFNPDEWRTKEDRTCVINLLSGFDKEEFIKQLCCDIEGIEVV